MSLESVVHKLIDKVHGDNQKALADELHAEVEVPDEQENQEDNPDAQE